MLPTTVRTHFVAYFWADMTAHQDCMQCICMAIFYKAMHIIIVNMVH